MDIEECRKVGVISPSSAAAHAIFAAISGLGPRRLPPRVAVEQGPNASYPYPLPRNAVDKVDAAALRALFNVPPPADDR